MLAERVRGSGAFQKPAPVAALAAILLLAFVLRLAYRTYMGSADFWQNRYGFFYEIATNIVAGRGFGVDDAWAIRPPVYPCFLALSALAGGNYLLIVVPQALLGAGTALCAYLIADELFDRRSAVVAALLTAVYPYYVVHDTALQETGMATFAAALSTYLLLRARTSQSAILWLAAGALLALGVLIRVTLLPFARAAVAWLAAFGQGPREQRLVRASVAALVLFLGVGAWVMRNYNAVGRPVLTSEAGFQFWMAHNPLTFSRYPTDSMDHSTELAFAALTPADRAELAVLAGDELSRNDWFFRRGLAYVRSNPGDTFEGALRKIAAGFSWVLNPRRGSLVQIPYLLSYGPISLLGIIGILLTRPAWRLHSVIYLQFLTFAGVTAIFWAHTNHRSYLDVYLIVFAAVVVERLLYFGGRSASA